ncbi:hypothetical protein THIOM_004644 [Candidatus Thiomargarita nelsonii]|uniref:Uncharacterized protein n=1 Tax=Candidatus Thiomargarita nelsonii TaxID=1003181 RepID=A0A176RVF8_9GAMM|nr:hypothetical protein THIOM_004644 [Candidatus Thiomargarita nelsonii]
MLASNVLEKGRICQEQLEEIVAIALESLKTLMVDCQTPLEIRLQVAFRLFEIFGTDNKELIMHGVKKNARKIESNAHQLSDIKRLLKRAVETKPQPLFINEKFSQTNSQKFAHFVAH